MAGFLPRMPGFSEGSPWREKTPSSPWPRGGPARVAGPGVGHPGPPPPGAAGGIIGPDGGTLWLWGRAVRITGLCSLKSLAQSPGVRKSSRRSPGRPRRRGGAGGGGGAAAGSAPGAAAAQRPAGAKRSPRPGGTTGSFPGKPRRRCSGWSRSCPRRCRRCPGRRRPPSAAARRSPRRSAPRPAAKHKVARRWPPGAAPKGSHRSSTFS